MAKTYSDTKGQTAPAKLGDFELTLPDGYTPSGHHHGAQKSFSSTRSATHRGRQIKVRTTYRIEIDGAPLTMHTMVLDDGTVHCHGLPNYAFRSALDMARALIDAQMLAHEPKDELGGGAEGGDHMDHGGHGGGHDGGHH